MPKPVTTPMNPTQEAFERLAKFVEGPHYTLEGLSSDNGTIIGKFREGFAAGDVGRICIPTEHADLPPMDLSTKLRSAETLADVLTAYEAGFKSITTTSIKPLLPSSINQVNKDIAALKTMIVKLDS